MFLFPCSGGPWPLLREEKVAIIDCPYSRQNPPSDQQRGLAYLLLCHKEIDQGTTGVDGLKNAITAGPRDQLGDNREASSTRLRIVGIKRKAVDRFVGQRSLRPQQVIDRIDVAVP